MNKTALITGASRGLGMEFARIYAKHGYDLVITARTSAELTRLKQELEETCHVRVTVLVKDLAKPDAALEIFDFCQENGIAVDVLVNNAGFGDYGKFIEAKWQKQADMVQVNIVTVMQLTYCFAPEMVKRKHGRIINLASVASFSAGPKMSIYYASKAFVRSFSEAVAEELKGTGVTVTAVCPGPTDTGFKKAAGLDYSKMFTIFKPANAKKVAEAGVRASEKGRVLNYSTLSVKLGNIGARLVPRSISRKFAMKVNE